ncbi:hypothetical protein EYZ11_008747 [Aspergillus tanneri]|uniref:Homeobox domain-containing protein n=1 Tax=Aspergillus tanneri TaxID=1220188 RepID=A0A4S3JA38_9EURO|nr:uncharacterized protein ATNIH1004_002753 [Aspergillus tanneri]KAA8650072.1 hypothetical protein ATNIH1004_002753 [Aspergillus tanneri]THC91795.1 hypothetical protein EYZ11_008747 [Aspergillus tanneri]
MQSTVLKAENAFSAAKSTDTSAQNRYSGGELSEGISEKQKTEVEGNSSLSMMRLDKLNHSEPVLSASGNTASPDAPSEVTPAARKGEQEEMQEYEKENEDTMAVSSDEGAVSSTEKRTSSDAKTDKKKMKRFRLTHNQTRFLMSEFTRQAHPDAAHRERLSREIPGLTPRQVQVWFQNRRAKLKRLTSNDRERMLKSRALPDDFDTTQVLRTPFDGRPSETPMLLTDGLQRINDDDYVISPLSSTSTTGNGFSSAAPDRNLESYPPPGPITSRGPPAPISELQRNSRGPFPFPRSSSFSEPSYNTGLHFPGRFSRSGEPLGHPCLPYARRPTDFGISRPPNGMILGYDHHRQLEGSVSPNGPPDHSVPYSVDSHNQQAHSYQQPHTMPAPKGIGGLEMTSQIQSHGRHMPTIQSIPVSESSDYRPYSYDHHPYSLSATMPFTQANASSMSLPASFPSETSSINHGTVGSSPEDRMPNPPQVLDPLRAKFGNQPFDYTNYL